MHNNTSELDLWAYHTIDGPWEPEDSYLASYMTFVRNDICTPTQIYESNKRKHDAMGPEEVSDGMSAEESMYNTTVLAMTPKTMEARSDSLEEAQMQAVIITTAIEAGSIEEAISHDAAMYHAPLAAMTPKTEHDTSPPSPDMESL